MIRILRPLRSISKIPGLKKIIGALVDSAASLSNVILLLVFLLTAFSIAGGMFWKGLLHYRCRLTPFPVVMPANCRKVGLDCWNHYLTKIISNPSAFRCLPHENDNLNWTQSSSPWFKSKPQDCFWPIDHDDKRVCTVGLMGENTCPPIMTHSFGRIERTCGSHFDKFGNARFIDSVEPYGYPRMQAGTFIKELNYGYTNYDNFFNSFISTFQVVSMEGWTDILYQLMDSWGSIPSVFTFTLIVILVGQIALNLVLAVITESMEKLDESADDDSNQKENTEECLLPFRESFLNIKVPKIGSARMKNLIESSTFKGFVMMCITMNTIVLACDHYGISTEFQKVLETLNCFLTLVFRPTLLLVSKHL